QLLTIFRQLLLAALVVCACTPRAHAQQSNANVNSTNRDTATISGRVTDARGASIAGATLTLYARDARATNALATATDETGAYRFERLAAPGEYILQAEAAGFARSAARVLRVERGGDVRLDIPLEVAGVNTEVVVIAADSAQTVDEVSKAVTVVGRTEIEERDESLIAEALRTVPGLRVQQLGGPGALTTIKTRGLRTQDTAVLIDGLRFRDATAPQGDASGFLSDLLVTGTNRVEVLRGSGSSLYGTNAVGGVVNVVTDEGGGPFHGNLLAEGGGLGYFRGRAQVAGGAGVADRLIYSAGVSHLNVARGVDGDDATRNTNAHGRALLRLAPTATLSARIYTGDSFLQLNENPLAVGVLPASGVVQARPLSATELRRFETGTSINQLDAGAATFIPSANDPDNSRTTRFFTGAITFAQRPTEAFGYSVTYQGLSTRGSFSEGPAGPGNPADRPFFLFNEPLGNTRSIFQGRIHTLNARTDFRLGRHNFFNAGYEFESESYVNNSFAVSPSDDSDVSVRQRSHALFVQDQLRFLDERLQLSAAFRAQFFTLGQPRFTPAANAPYLGTTFDAPPDAYTGDGSVSYFFRSTNTKLRAHVGNGYRAPSLFERFGTFFDNFGGAFSPLGDPRLRPDRSIAFDAGLDQSLADNRLRLSATYFYTRLQEVVGFGPVGSSDPFGRLFDGFINTGGGLARGAELSLTATPTRTLNLFAAYTYTNSDQRTPPVGNVLTVFGIPAHQFSLVATQRVGPRFFVNFDLTAASNYLVGSIFDLRTFANPVYRFDGPVKADIGASYTLPLARAHSLRFFGKIENLFDRENFENGFRTPRRRGLAGAAYSF
ncbi:MAG TPA: TonB-dependent receptor, partial [Pyrinomonadaceae bacterium]|nr:TonB-dependent receptor [Pyrinomonadaceae bacterium]